MANNDATLYPSTASETTTGVPVAVAVGISPCDNFQPRARDHESAVAALQALDMPRGLAKTVSDAVVNFPLRIMIVDNSGSMQHGDGQRLVKGKGGESHMLQCSRWAELTEDVVTIASMSEAANARTDFHLLNRRPAMDTLSIATDAYSRVPPLGPSSDCNAVQAAMKQSPGGTTPLTEAVMRVVSMLEPHASSLRASGETIAVIIATDGLPDNPQSFQEAMLVLQRLPVWLVVRLCTDDESIVSYWNKLDEQLEAPMEVLDDLRSEAIEVTSVNPWLVYGPALHAARLFGLPGKLFDAIDEQSLTPSDIKNFLQELLDVMYLPEPEVDIGEFVKAVGNKQAAMNLSTVDPKSLRRRPWIDLRTLERCVRHGGNGQSQNCAII